MKLYLFSENGVDCMPTGKKIEHRADNFLEAFQTFAPIVKGKQTKQKYLIVCPDGTYWTGEKY